MRHELSTWMIYESRTEYMSDLWVTNYVYDANERSRAETHYHDTQYVTLYAW